MPSPSAATPPAVAPSGDLLQSALPARKESAGRAGFFPLALATLPLGALSNIAVYLRTTAQAETTAPFTLYSAASVTFREAHRERLQAMGVRYIYLPMVAHGQFRKQLESHLQSLVTDPRVAINTKAEMVYETSVEIIDELLSDGNIAERMPSLKTVAKAVTTLAVADGAAFPHLFAASQHDFYTATHMVNVGTWMVALAFATGTHDPDELGAICLAGMVHDIGKIFVPEEVLNKRERLSDEDWAYLKSHPAKGADHLKGIKELPEVALRVTREHHERLDGTGYPDRLIGYQMHPMSKLCAVVDSFDAMTAVRPFKTSTCSFAEALRRLRSEAGSKYDAQIVDAWGRLMRNVDPTCDAPPAETPAPDRFGRRAHERFTIDCPARVHALSRAGNAWVEGPSHPVTVHSISRGGLGFLSQIPSRPAAYLRVYLMGSGSLAHKVVDAQVARVRDYKDGWSETGLRTVNLDQELKSLSAAASASPA
jgi:HD-GYP domain-containing protein (c-di-GMP phosphodiesterase class II)